MDIRIVLDPHSEVVTTGDTVTGRVILDVRKKASVTSVDVKLRGYIKTSLLSENDMDTDTWRPYHDKHEVFPDSADFSRQTRPAANTSSGQVSPLVSDPTTAGAGPKRDLGECHDVECWTARLSI